MNLPINLDDTVYWRSHYSKGILSGTVQAIEISRFGIDLKIKSTSGNIVKKELEKVYLSREEAEKALKEGKS